MAFIRVTDEPDADDALKEAYAKVGAARGHVANILKIHSVNPGSMTGHLELYRTLMLGAPTWRGARAVRRGDP